MSLHDRDFSVLIRAALAGLSAAILVAVSPVPGAFAADEEDSDASDAGSTFLRNVLTTFGLQRSDGNSTIEYRERSPLVVPPKLDLPPPEPPGAATNTPRWPNDPDVKRRREVAAARKKEVYDSAIDDSRLLTREELARGRLAGANARAAGQREIKDVDETVLPASEMTKGSKKSGFWSIFSSEPETAPFTGEPPRTALTEPPPGYRTPSSSQIYGVGHKVESKPYDLMEKKGTEE